MVANAAQIIPLPDAGLPSTAEAGSSSGVRPHLPQNTCALKGLCGWQVDAFSQWIHTDSSLHYN